MMKDSLNVSYKTDYFPVFQKPKIIGFYSVDGNRKLDPSASNLKYFYSDEGKIRYDLNSGFDDYIPKPSTTENVEKIDTLLLWLNRQNLLKKMINEDSKVNFQITRIMINKQKYIVEFHFRMVD